MRTDRQTDMTKLTVAFRKFANAIKDVTVQILRTDMCADRWLCSSWDTSGFRRLSVLCPAPQKLRTLHCVRQFGYEEDFGSHVPSPLSPPVCMFGNLTEQVRLLFRYIERLLTATSTPLNMYSICRFSCICEGKDQDDLPSLLSCVMEAECVYVCVCPVNSATHICLKITHDLCVTIIDTVTTFE